MLTTTQKIWQRWVAWREGSDNGRILNAMLIVGASTLIVNLTAFARELVIAYQFGLSDELDAFLIAFMIPLFTVTVFSGSIQAAFVPAYVETKKKHGLKQAIQLAQNTLSSALLLMTLITIVLIVFSETLLTLTANSFDEAKLSLTIRLFYFLQPILLLRVIIDVLRGILNSEDHFVVAALAPVFIYLVPIVFLLWGGNVLLLTIGTLFGYGVQVLLLWGTLFRQGVTISWQLPRFDAELKTVWNQYLPMVFGALIMGSSNIIDQTMATWSGSGGVSALVVGQRVSMFVIGIAVMSIGTAVLPNFSKMIAENRLTETKNTVYTYSFALLGLSAIGTTILWYFSEPITALIFERGAFTADDTILVSHIQRFYFLQIPWYIVSIIFVRLISALRKNQFLTYGAVLNVAINIGGNLLFLQWFGLAGIALSTVLVYVVSFSYLASIAWWLLRGRESYV